jgi:hypothetical protein
MTVIPAQHRFAERAREVRQIRATQRRIQLVRAQPAEIAEDLAWHQALGRDD